MRHEGVTYETECDVCGIETEGEADEDGEVLARCPEHEFWSNEGEYWLDGNEEVRYHIDTLEPLDNEEEDEADESDTEDPGRRNAAADSHA